MQIKRMKKKLIIERLLPNPKSAFLSPVWVGLAYGVARIAGDTDQTSYRKEQDRKSIGSEWGCNVVGQRKK